MSYPNSCDYQGAPRLSEITVKVGSLSGWWKRQVEGSKRQEPMKGRGPQSPALDVLPTFLPLQGELSGWPSAGHFSADRAQSSFIS